MGKAFTVLFIVTIALNVHSQNTIKLEKVWATDKVFQTPECVAIDYKNKVLFVSNVNENPWELDWHAFAKRNGHLRWFFICCRY